MGNSSSSHNHEPLDRHGAFQRGTYGDAINTVRNYRRRKSRIKGNAPKIFYVSPVLPPIIKQNSNLLPPSSSLLPLRNPPHSARARNRRNAKWTVCVDPSETRSGGEKTVCPSPRNHTNGNPTSRPFVPPPVPSPSSISAVLRSTSRVACKSARRR